MIKKLFAVTLLLFTIIQFVNAQQIALKSNLLYGGATFTPNLGVELGMGKKTTVDIFAGHNPWNINGTTSDNTKLAHTMAQIEFRYWPCQRFNGHFFGLHFLYTQYNISGYELPLIFGSGSKNYRYQGDAPGVGISYGYQWILGKRWSLEANLGGGVAFMDYRKYDCSRCGTFIQHKNPTYFGITRAGISLIYIIK